MKVRIIERPTGLINGAEWPEAGETIDLPDVVAKSMIGAGTVEEAKPAAKKAAAKKDDDKPVEKRPAAKAGVEKRPAKKS